MAENKTQPTDEPVAAFLARVADPKRRADCETVLAMMRRASGVEPVMWGSQHRRLRSATSTATPAAAPATGR